MQAIRLNWPDAETVDVFMGEKHVATMKLADKQNVPVELFNLMRAAPDMHDALRLLMLDYPQDGARRRCDCKDMLAGYKCQFCLAWEAIQKAEGSLR